MDMEIAPDNINNTRLKLKWLTERGNLWSRPSRDGSPTRGHSRPAAPEQPAYLNR
ncbi:hypothetical protein ABZ619_43420 [Streptomyces sp. NPDC007851]|uniref:hypothetical protein n=1 Tax=Streptomyces sp. NPDC007851 TaxID=3155008 RepID=UPI0033E3041C